MSSDKKIIGIIGAMDIEVEGIAAEIENKVVERYAMTDFISGDMYGKKVVVAKCGVGKVAAAVCTEIMILKYSPDVIVNSGIAGTLTNKLSIGDIAVSQYAIEHDMDTTTVGDPFGFISGINQIYLKADEGVASELEKCIDKIGVRHERGIIATGDVFVDDDIVKRRIHALFDRDDFECIACEMEGGAVAHTCYLGGVPFCILRAISDGGDDNSHMDYPKFAALAAERSIKVIKMYIQNA